MTPSIIETPDSEHRTVTRSKRISYRWGSEIGDVHEYFVSINASGSVRIAGPRWEGEVPAVVAGCIARAVLRFVEMHERGELQ